ncbi:hypothetical protein SUGI_0673770 [Cryptomeria japonica]|nr:hypothetical protein SUGI_0673770 [Cryptomeria japonica]
MATAEHLYPFAQDFILITVLTVAFILFLYLLQRYSWLRHSGKHTAVQRDNAFEEIAPPSTSASKKLPFDVFINHRGPDTKHTLASSIYSTLHGMGLQVFLDKEVLELGDSIPSEIEEAMRTSFLHIAIL